MGRRKQKSLVFPVGNDFIKIPLKSVKNVTSINDQLRKNKVIHNGSIIKASKVTFGSGRAGCYESTKTANNVIKMMNKLESESQS